MEQECIIDSDCKESYCYYNHTLKKRVCYVSPKTTKKPVDTSLPKTKDDDLPEQLEILENRLNKRGNEPPQLITKRLKK